MRLNSTDVRRKDVKGRIQLLCVESQNALFSACFPRTIFLFIIEKSEKLKKTVNLLRIYPSFAFHFSEMQNLFLKVFCAFTKSLKKNFSYPSLGSYAWGGACF